MAATGNQPQLWVNVSHAREGARQASLQVVPDTGAQVCIAGPSLLAALNIKPATLKRRAGLRDVANVVLKPMDSTTCHIEYSGRRTTQEVFFIETASRCNISLETCRELGLVHADFPHQSPAVASPATGSSSSTEEPNRPRSHSRRSKKTCPVWRSGSSVISLRPPLTLTGALSQ